MVSPLSLRPRASAALDVASPGPSSERQMVAMAASMGPARWRARRASTTQQGGPRPCPGLAPSGRCDDVRHRIRAVQSAAGVVESQGVKGPTSEGARAVASLLPSWGALSRDWARSPGQSGSAEAPVVLEALKLLLSSDPPASRGLPGGAPGDPAAPAPTAARRALLAAQALARLGAQGLPVDAEVLAAALATEPVLAGRVPLPALEARLGSAVAALVHDIAAVRRAPSRVDLYDDEASVALRELCLSFYDPRAVLVEFIYRLNDLREQSDAGPTPLQQVSAMESLQVFAALGYSLGLPDLAAEMEDLCFRSLFPETFAETRQWLRADRASLVDALEAAEARVRDLCAEHAPLADLCAGFEVKARMKSLISVMKKLLSLHKPDARKKLTRADLHDLLGIRVVVHPRTDVPGAEAERLARQACYDLSDLVANEWPPVEGRTKDYIARPKRNGYQSIHVTVRLPDHVVDVPCDAEAGPDCVPGLAFAPPTDTDASMGDVPATVLEVQIRTAGMDARAESGGAAHGAYKGGLAAEHARELRALASRRLRAARRGAQGSGRGAEAAGVGPGVARVAEEESVSLEWEGDGSGAAWEEAAAVDVFRAMDLDGSGTVSRDEVEALVGELMGGAEEGVEDAVKEVMAMVDENGDGVLSLEEFLAFRRHLSVLMSLEPWDGAASEALRSRAWQAGAEAASSAVATGAEGQSGGAGAGVAGESGSSARALRAGALAGRMAPGVSRAKGGAGLARRWGGVACFASPRSGRSYAAALAAEGAVARRADVALRGPRKAGSEQGAGAGRDAGAGRGAEGATGVSTTMDELDGLSTGDEIDRGASEESFPEWVDGEGVEVELQMLREGGEWGAEGIGSDGSGDEGSSGDESSGSESAGGVATQDGSTVPGAAQGGAGEARVAVPVPVSAEEEEGKARGRTTTRGGAGSARRSTKVTRAERGDVLEGSPEREEGPRFNNLITRTIWGLPLTAVWGLRPLGTLAHLQQLPGNELLLPRRGPCVVGAVEGRGSDVLLDAPVVSGAHARLETVVRDGRQYLLVTDLGSTNGTFVNRGRIRPHYDVMVRPGDVVAFADADLAFRVVALRGDEAPERPDEVARARALVAARGRVGDEAGAGVALGVAVGEEEGEGEGGGDVSGAEWEGAWGMDGCGWEESDDEVGAATVAAWAEREGKAGRVAVARVLFRAADDRMEQAGGDTSTGAGVAGVDADALADAWCAMLSAWARMEADARNDTAARRLFRRAAAAAGAGGEGIPRAAAAVVLHRWAHWEFKALANTAAALRLLAEAEVLSPGNPRVLQLKGTVLAASRDGDGARLAFQKALEADPNNASALQAWGRLEARAGRMREARRLFGQAAGAAGADNVVVLQAWAVAEARAGRFAAARTLFQRAAGQAPDSAAVLQAWGLAEHAAGDGDAARALLARAVAAEPRNVRALNAAARLARLAGDGEEARALLGRALAVVPDHAPSLNELRMLEEQAGNAEAAAELKARVAALNARAPQPHNVTRKTGKWFAPGARVKRPTS